MPRPQRTTPNGGNAGFHRRRAAGRGSTTQSTRHASDGRLIVRFTTNLHWSQAKPQIRVRTGVPRCHCPGIWRSELGTMSTTVSQLAPPHLSAFKRDEGVDEGTGRPPGRILLETSKLRFLQAPMHLLHPSCVCDLPQPGTWFGRVPSWEFARPLHVLLCPILGQQPAREQFETQACLELVGWIFVLPFVR